jgi:hypothetical protein
MGQDIEQKERPSDGIHKKDSREMIATSDPNLIVMGDLIAVFKTIGTVTTYDITSSRSPIK